MTTAKVSEAKASKAKTSKAKKSATAKTPRRSRQPKTPVLVSAKDAGIPCYTLPAIRGIQSEKTFYTAMLPLPIMREGIFKETEDVPPALRAQRIPKPAKKKAICQYVLQQKNYVLPAITCSIDIPSRCKANCLHFEPANDNPNCDMGELWIPMEATVMINDGQHRVGGLLQAIEKNFDLLDESIPVSFYVDLGLKASQQMFFDLNNFASKPTSSLNQLYDHCGEKAGWAKSVMTALPVFDRFTDCERTSVGKKSTKMFTLNGISSAVEIFRKNIPKSYFEQEDLTAIIVFWRAVASQMPDWKRVTEGEVSAGAVRHEQISAHAITLEALAFVGASLFSKHGKQEAKWKPHLDAIDLASVDWRKENPDWQDVFIFGGSIKKTKATARAFAGLLLERSMTHEPQPEKKAKK